MIRLFVASTLAPGATAALQEAQTRYLTRVMRLGSGDALAVFNGTDGEWAARIETIGKRDCVLRVEALTRAPAAGPDLDFLAPLVKRAALETMVEKAVELGVRRIRLIVTERTNADHANLARLDAIAIEAAEQCERLDAPTILPPQRLDAALGAWEPVRRLMVCEERGAAPPAAEALAEADTGPWAVLVGPEGGFSAQERAALRALPGALPVSLGPRILRAETAAIVALAAWQSALGDWRGT